MTVEQRWDTQREKVTAAGRVLTVIYTCTWSDWRTDFDHLPVIGDAWEHDEELVCTDIEVEGVDNVHCTVTATFSTEGPDARVGRADQASSWRETIDASMEEQSVTAYFDRAAGGWQSWPARWTARGEGFTEANMPDLVVHKPRLVFATTAYGSVLFVGRVLGSLGKVNSNTFLGAYTARRARASATYQDDFNAAAADTGCWLFAHCHIERVNKNSWRFDFTFLHDPDGWNGQHGVAINVYETCDFMLLLEAMDRDGADRRGAGGQR